MNLGNLNPGIRKTVAWLIANGFETCDSGDGETREFECDLDVPYVHMQAHKDILTSEACRLAGLLHSVGINIQQMDEQCSVPAIEAHYNPADGSNGFITLYNVKL